MGAWLYLWYYCCNPMSIAVGRALDALVAEKVMGLECIRLVDKTVDDDREWFALVADGEPRRRAGMFGLHCGYWEIQRYSADIASAWLVVEKLQDRFHVFLGRVAPFACGNKKSAWNVQFTGEWKSGEPMREIHEAIAETAPEAICRAALAAVGVEDEEV